MRANMEVLGPRMSSGANIVGIEPSCIAAFRDESGNLFPADENARRLKAQTYTLAEFLDKCAPEFEPPRIERPVVVQGHCHHKAIMGMDAEQKLYESMGVDFGGGDWGCCGMAGGLGQGKGEG